MKEAIDFYTHVLDFQLADSDSPEDFVVTLFNENAELILTALEGDQKAGINIYIRVTEVDNLFKKYVSRGLKIPNRPESPVHNGPLDQTWGMREFYVDDPSGNTLRFGKVIE
jgi:predicted enzyme related to lactoylglutathione lyase